MHVDIAGKRLAPLLNSFHTEDVSKKCFFHVIYAEIEQILRKGHLVKKWIIGDFFSLSGKWREKSYLQLWEQSNCPLDEDIWHIRVLLH